MSAEAAPYPLSEAADILGDLMTVALLAGPAAYLMAASWLVSDIVAGYLHTQGICAHPVPACQES